MKSILLLLACIISTTLFAQTIYPSGVAGCIARWTFDSPEGGILTTIDDMSGNNNNGSNNFITSTTGWKGYSGTAGAFDGTSSWSEVPHNNSLNCPTEVTMISLLKFNSFNNALCQFNQVLSKGYPHFIAGNYGHGVGESPYDNDCNIFSPTKEQLVAQSGNGILSTPVGNFLQLNKWYFLANTISPTNVINYQIEMDINNKALSITPINNTIGNFNIGNNTQNISLGKHLNPQYPYWTNAEIDEIILFNRVLSPTELLSVYDYLFGPVAPSATISPILAPTLFTVYSTPSELVIQTQEQAYSYELYNITGQLLQKNDHLQGIQHIDISEYASSLFILKMTTNKQQTQVIKCSH